MRMDVVCKNYYVAVSDRFIRKLNMNFGCCKKARMMIYGEKEKNMNNTYGSTNNNLNNEGKKDEVDKCWQDIISVKNGSCLIVLIITICVAIYAFSHGNPSRLLHPTNSNGELCGQHNQTDKPNLFQMCRNITRRDLSHNTSVHRRMPKHVLDFCSRQSLRLRKILQERV